MKPGVTSFPVASISSAASPTMVAATFTMRPFVTATSATRAGAPVPSTTVPPRISRSNIRTPVRFSA